MSVLGFGDALARTGVGFGRPRHGARSGLARRRSTVGRGLRWLAARVPFGGPKAGVCPAVALVGAVVFLTWFTAGHFLASGDIAPFYRQGLTHELGSLWTHQQTGAGGPSYDFVRAPEVAFIGIARAVGGGAPLAERLFFAATLAFAAAGSSTLVARFARGPVVVFLAGLLGAFNLQNLASMPNYLPLIVTGVLGLLTAFAIDAARGERCAWLAAALATLPLSQIALNPPLIMVMVVVVACLPVIAAALTGTGRRGAGRALVMLAKAALLAVPLALWWALPLLHAVTRATSSGSIGAETDVLKWAWTHRRNSIANVMTFRSAWSWPDPAYQGHAGRLLGAPLVSWMAWLLPMGIPLAALVGRADRRRAVYWLGLGFAVLVVVGKGLHAPLRTLNLALYEHVPGFWLLREPMGKVGFLVLFAVLVCWALALEGLAARLRALRRPLRRAAHAAAIGLLVVGPVTFAWPMLTGSVAKDEYSGRSEQVQVPEGWHEIANAVNTSPVQGKALVLPLVDFYQMPTTWGLYATDILARGMVARPVIIRNPQGYITDVPNFDQFIRSTEAAVAEGRVADVLPLLRRLGASHVIVRRDFDRASAVRATDVAEPATLTATLDQVPALQRTVDNAIGTVYETTDPGVEPVQAKAGLLSAPSVDGNTLADSVTAIPDSLVSTTDGGVATVGTAWASTVSRASPLETYAEADYTVTRHEVGAGSYQATIEPAAEGTQLVLRDPAAVQLSSRLPELGDDPSASGDVVSLPGRAELRAELGPGAVGAEVDGTEYTGAAFTVVADRATVVRPLIEAPSSALGAFGPLADCNRHDDRTPEELGFETAELDIDGGTVIALGGTAHRPCRSAPIAGATAGGRFHVRLAARTVEGATPTACLWAEGPNRCVDLPAAIEADGWSTIDGLARLPAGTTSAELFLYADPPPDGSGRTLVHYELPVLKAVQAADPVPLGGPGTTEARAVHLPGGRYSLLSSTAEAVTAGAWSPVGDCARSDDRSLADVGIASSVIDDGGIELRAREHSACVWASLDGVLAGAAYDLVVDHATHAGHGTRVCVFDMASRRCIALEADGKPAALSGASTWTRARLRFVAPAMSAGSAAPAPALRLFLYADGASEGTVVRYRDVEVARAIDDVVSVVKVDSIPPTPPAISWQPNGTSRYRVAVHGASGPFVLTLSEAWSPEWLLEGLPEGATVTHVMADGYRNAWLIDARGDLDLTLRYGPDRWAHRAVLVSAMALFVAALIGAFRLIHLGSRRAPSAR